MHHYREAASMSEPIPSAPQGGEIPPDEDGEELQFDQAEFATPAGDGPACTVCHRPIAAEYYELNSKVFCAECRRGVEVAFRGGSRLFRVIKALLLGSMAAAGGFVIYYAIVHVTGWNFGIVAVVVGLMVGNAVRRGSGNRGGLGYQLLAVFLTYSVIVAMHVPDLFEVLAQASREGPANDQKPAKVLPEKGDRDRTKAEDKAPSEVGATKAQKAGTKPGQAPSAAPGVPGAANDSKDVLSPKAAATVEELPGAKTPPALDIGRVTLVLAFLIGLAYSLPVIKAFSAPISGVIFGFALWEAWKMNRRVVLAFNGPFRLGTVGPDDASSPEVSDDGE
jgi:hypothetical protein